MDRWQTLQHEGEWKMRGCSAEFKARIGSSNGSLADKWLVIDDVKHLVEERFGKLDVLEK